MSNVSNEDFDSAMEYLVNMITVIGVRVGVLERAQFETTDAAFDAASKEDQDTMIKSTENAVKALVKLMV